MADIHQPHDRLFRAVFSDASEAVSLLRNTLPDTIRNSFDWTTLALRDGTFIDEELRENQTDLLYRVEHAETGQLISVYVLLEHQSSPDPWMRLRLLRYCCRIWEDDLRGESERRELRPIVPIVFYQGAREWTYSTEFADLFPEAARAWPWIPRFAHVLLDQTARAPEAVAGNVKARIAQLLMMAAFGRQAPEALRLAAALASSLEASGEHDNLDLFLSYLTTTQESEGIDTFKETMQHHGIDIGGKLMTYAQELLEKGRAEGQAQGRAEGQAQGRAEGQAQGRMENQVEVVEGLLRVGVTWDVIEAATGLTETGFQALKSQLADTDS